MLRRACRISLVAGEAVWPISEARLLFSSSGTFKTEISDAKCTGKCPANMHSYVQGADSEQSLRCLW